MAAHLSFKQWETALTQRRDQRQRLQKIGSRNRSTQKAGQRAKNRAFGKMKTEVQKQKNKRRQDQKKRQLDG